MLLLDEHSLGLSPLPMQQVAGIIRAVHARGVAALVVEQNISPAPHLILDQEVGTSEIPAALARL